MTTTPPYPTRELDYFADLIPASRPSPSRTSNEVAGRPRTSNSSSSRSNDPLRPSAYDEPYRSPPPASSGRNRERDQEYGDPVAASRTEAAWSEAALNVELAEIYDRASSNNSTPRATLLAPGEAPDNSLLRIGRGAAAAPAPRGSWAGWDRDVAAAAAAMGSDQSNGGYGRTSGLPPGSYLVAQNTTGGPYAPILVASDDDGAVFPRTGMPSPAPRSVDAELYGHTGEPLINSRTGLPYETITEADIPLLPEEAGAFFAKELGVPYRPPAAPEGPPMIDGTASEPILSEFYTDEESWNPSYVPPEETSPVDRPGLEQILKEFNADEASWNPGYEAPVGDPRAGGPAPESSGGEADWNPSYVPPPAVADIGVGGPGSTGSEPPAPDPELSPSEPRPLDIRGFADASRIVMAAPPETRAEVVETILRAREILAEVERLGTALAEQEQILAEERARFGNAPGVLGDRLSGARGLLARHEADLARTMDDIVLLVSGGDPFNSLGDVARAVGNDIAAGVREAPLQFVGAIRDTAQFPLDVADFLTDSWDTGAEFLGVPRDFYDQERSGLHLPDVAAPESFLGGVVRFGGASIIPGAGTVTTIRGAGTAGRLAGAADEAVDVAGVAVGGVEAGRLAETAGGLAGAALPVPGRTVTVFRVEGTPNQRISIDTSGNVSLVPENNGMLWLNFGQEERAGEFLRRRVEQGLVGAEIKSFEVNEEFLQELRRMAVPEGLAKENPGMPLISNDPYPDQFGLRQDQFDRLIESITGGSGNVRGE